MCQKVTVLCDCEHEAYEYIRCADVGEDHGYDHQNVEAIQLDLENCKNYDQTRDSSRDSGLPCEECLHAMIEHATAWADRKHEEEVLMAAGHQSIEAHEEARELLAWHMQACTESRGDCS